MSDINTVTLIGNLTFDAKLDYLPGSNTPKVTIQIATNRDVKRGEKWEKEASFFEVQYFGKAAEGVKPYLLKGKKIGVSGHLQQDRWEKDGAKHNKVYIVADSLNLLGGKPEAEKDPTEEATVKAVSRNFGGSVQKMPKAPEVNNDGSFPEDIPF